MTKTMCGGGFGHWVREQTMAWFAEVPLPKEAVLVNARLGVLYKILQLFAACGAAYIISQNYFSEFAPTDIDIDFWREDGQAAGRGPHCENPSIYEYNFSSAFQYKPTRCESLHLAEDNQKASKTMFFMTYVRDTVVNNDLGAACPDLRTRCGAQGGSFLDAPAAQQGGDSRCHCSFNDEFFVQNQEQTTFSFRHSYQVQDSFLTWSYQTGSSSLPYYMSGNLGRQSRINKYMVSKIKKQDGSPCFVGGRSEYKPSDGDIRGTLSEWLACAGLHLDEQSELTKNSHDPEQTDTAPHVRLSGAKVLLELSYNNRGLDIQGDVATVCEITVYARPAWVARERTDYMMLADSLQGTTANRYRSRSAHGIEFSFKRGGSFSFFNPTTLVTGIVNAVVLVSLPVQAIRFIALYGIGVVSKVYTHVLRQRFSIFDQFHGMIARMMVAAIGFRALTKQWTAKVEELEPMRRDQVEKYMVEALGKDVKQTDRKGNPILNQDEVKLLATVVTAGMDRDGSGQVSFEEFVHAASSNEWFDTRTMIKFFDADRRDYPQERVFDCTRQQIMHIHAKRRQLKLSHTVLNADDLDVEAIRSSEKSGRLKVAGSILDTPVFCVQSVRRTQI